MIRQTASIFETEAKPQRTSAVCLGFRFSLVAQCIWVGIHLEALFPFLFNGSAE